MFTPGLFRKPFDLTFFLKKSVKVKNLNFLVFRRKSTSNGLSQIDLIESKILLAITNNSEYFKAVDFKLKNKIFIQKLKAKIMTLT